MFNQLACDCGKTTPFMGDINQLIYLQCSWCGKTIKNPHRKEDCPCCHGSGKFLGGVDNHVEFDCPRCLPKNPESEKQKISSFKFEKQIKFAMGDRVRKKGDKGQWHGKIVGFYSASCTPLGYAVESERETGSVQIYPESALELIKTRALQVGDHIDVRLYVAGKDKQRSYHFYGENGDASIWDFWIDEDRFRRLASQIKTPAEAGDDGAGATKRLNANQSLQDKDNKLSPLKKEFLEALEELIDGYASVARDMRRIETGECSWDGVKDAMTFAEVIESDIDKFRRTMNRLAGNG